MRNKHITSLLGVLALLVAIISSCNKTTSLPAYTPNPTIIFAPGSLVHTKDSVNLGDTVYLNATGTIFDTTKTISVFLASNFSGPSSGVFTYGTATAPLKVNRVIGSQNSSGLYNWSAVLAFPAAAAANIVGHKTSLTITATYIYPLSLSSQLPTNMSITDAGTGPKTKTVYVK